MSKEKYICDNCKKNIVKKNGNWLKTAFQRGANEKGKIASWCSRKCWDEHQDTKNRCKIDVGFNALGMPVFRCLTHGKINSKYLRGKDRCYQKLAEKLNILTN